MKIKVDREKCIGCGICASLCPKNFKMIEGKSSPNAESVDNCGCDLDEVAESCPVEAIEIEK